MMTVWMLAAIGQAWWALPFVALAIHGSAPLYVRAAALAPSCHPLSSGELPHDQFQVLLAFGALVASLSGVFLGPRGPLWNPYGAMSGCLVAVAHALGVASAEVIGFPAHACAGGAASVLASAGIGLWVLDEAAWSSQALSAALTLLVLGVAAASLCTEVAQYVRGASERSPIIHGFVGDERWERASGAKRLGGVLVSACSGICAGASLAPLSLDPPGAAFLPSFGLGLLAASVLMLRGPAKVACPPRVLVSGVLAGVVWLFAHAVAMLAVLKLGYTRAVPTFCGQILVIRICDLLSGEIGGRRAWVLAMASLLFGTGSTLLLAAAHSG